MIYVGKKNEYKYESIKCMGDCGECETCQYLETITITEDFDELDMEKLNLLRLCQYGDVH